MPPPPGAAGVKIDAANGWRDRLIMAVQQRQPGSSSCCWPRRHPTGPIRGRATARDYAKRDTRSRDLSADRSPKPKADRRWRLVPSPRVGSIGRQRRAAGGRSATARLAPASSGRCKASRMIAHRSVSATISRPPEEGALMLEPPQERRQPPVEMIAIVEIVGPFAVAGQVRLAT